jgi:tRNA-splicing ligase RtcB
LLERHPRLDRGRDVEHLGTLGTGNHFVELCLDGEGHVWLMLHSGSRGLGNRFGMHFIELAKSDLRRAHGEVPDADLAYLSAGTRHFDDYVAAVGLAQRYARENRRLMTEQALAALRMAGLPNFRADLLVVNCHHNYVTEETHAGEEVLVTRKGAVRAGKGDLGIIPGSMGARSFIVRGKGNGHSLHSCSHGAGRVMSRTEARKRFSLEDHARATAGVECRKDDGVLDETPGAYKPIEAVMAAQEDLVEIVHELKQVLCVKG